jgi:hypothetical protein
VCAGSDFYPRTSREMKPSFSQIEIIMPKVFVANENFLRGETIGMGSMYAVIHCGNNLDYEFF